MDTAFSVGSSQQATGSRNDWSFTRIMGLSFFASLFSNANILDSAKLLILGSIIETGRRLCQWLIERFRFQYSITAQFHEGDPSYEWIVLFLTQENVWRRSRDFQVNAKNSKRKWAVKTGPDDGGNADYVPMYDNAQLFRWKGYWLEIKRNNGTQAVSHHGNHQAATIYVSIYTLNMTVLSNLVEEARLRYIEVSRPNVTVHMADMPNYGPGFMWSNVKHKARRPLSSIILLEGVVDSLVKDAREFIGTEDWYISAGIPHRRGYLLYGPPGTGKTSTIYALAGELGLEIYSLSLSSGFVDDLFLQKASSSIPKNSILLIEDIDCAFPSREDADDEEPHITSGYPGMVTPPFMGSGRKSSVTLSGLLNVIDGVGSEEGKLFFATTNYVDRLDPALLRPGRIDKKVQYKLATKAQASALFTRFFDESHSKSQPVSSDSASSEKPVLDRLPLATLAEKFAEDIPEHEFSTAELQGFLLSCKRKPDEAVAGIRGWVEHELAEKADKAERMMKRKEQARALKERREARNLEGTMARLGGIAMSMYPPIRGGMVMGGPAPPHDAPPGPHTPSPAYDDAQGHHESPLNDVVDVPIVEESDVPSTILQP